MSYARDEYTATAGQTVFTVTWPYLDQSHSVVTVDAVPVTYTWTGAQQITLDSGATLGSTVVLQRQTPHTALVTFTAGAPVTLENMETQRKQFTYIAEELEDRYDILNVGPAGPAGADGSPAFTSKHEISYGTRALALDASSFWADSSHNHPISERDRVYGESSDIPNIFSDYMNLVSGFWEVEIHGHFSRLVTGTLDPFVSWALVNNTTDTRYDNESFSMQLGEGGGTADGTPDVSFHLHKLLNLSATEAVALRVACVSGLNNNESATLNVQAMFTRLGDYVAP